MGARRRWLRQPARGPVGRAGAYFKPGRALHRPLCETVGYARRAAANSRCSRTAGRKSGTRRSGAGARAASTRPADSSEVPPSVVTVSLLERWNCVAQVLRLQRDYFKLDNYRGHDLVPPVGRGCTPVPVSHVSAGTCIITVLITCSTYIIQ